MAICISIHMYIPTLTHVQLRIKVNNGKCTVIFHISRKAPWIRAPHLWYLFFTFFIITPLAYTEETGTIDEIACIQRKSRYHTSCRFAKTKVQINRTYIHTWFESRPFLSTCRFGIKIKIIRKSSKRHWEL